MTTQPTATTTLRTLHQQLTAINQAAFAAGQYDVAYHALMAALHCVQTLKDVRGLRQVQHVAQEQLVWIDTHHPEYDHSTPSAKKRGHDSIFKTLARQAEARIQIVQAEAKLRPTKTATPDSEG